VIVPVFVGAVRSGTCVLFASLGELISERAGVVNLGIEGSMLVGALAGFAVTAQTGDAYLGIVAAGLAGVLLALVHAYLTVSRMANQIASGLALMTLAQGITAFFGRRYVSTQISGLPQQPIPFLSQLPLLGPILFSHDVLTYASLLSVPAVWIFLYRTRPGLVLRSTGEREEVAHAYGQSPDSVRYMAVLFSGLMAGIGGAQLSVAYTLNWVENMTQGRGFIAVAMVIFSSWRPVRAMCASYLFGGAYTLQLFLQSRGVGLSPFLLAMTPYVLTLVVLVVVGQQKYSMPEGLRGVFSGGE
jgi:simple sugar transport system permease protein